MPAVETYFETSVDSYAPIPAVVGIFPGFVEHPNTDAKWEIGYRPAKNEHQDTA